MDEKINSLRKKLNTLPETAWNEHSTTEALIDFLKENTSLEIVKKDKWFYARHFEGKGLDTICFRSDMDAITGKNGAFHGCGHDGHMAALCGLALAIEGRRLGKNICLLFQPAEETGEGAKICREIISAEGISRIYGFHNIPGFKEGLVLLKKGVFACSSMGMTVRLWGSRCHAAYPETGKNPTYIIGELIRLFDTTNRERNKDGIYITVVNVNVGSKNFGISPGYGEISFTLRAEAEEELLNLKKTIEEFIFTKAYEEDIKSENEIFDYFPETVNPSSVYDEVRGFIENEFLCKDLSVPMRWSEDFGWYLKECPGMFFGIGTGINAPGLHTDGYSYNDNVTETAIGLFLRLAEGEVL